MTLPRPQDLLLERQDELAIAEAALASARAGTGQILLVEGPAGIGKTGLVRAISARAHGQGFSVLEARGDDLLARLPYGLVSELLAPAVAAWPAQRRQEVAAGPAGCALRLFEGSQAAIAGPAEPHEAAALAYGLHWVIQDLAESAPVLLSIDDAHWADPASLRALAWTSRRLDGLGLVVVVAARSDPDPDVGELLARLGDVPEGRRLVLHPLSVGAVGELARQRLENPDPTLTHRLALATGGNPFLLGELLAGLEATGLGARGLGATGWRGIGADQLELATVAPDSIARFVLRRLALAGDDCQRLARAVAVLGEAGLREAAALADLTEESAVAAADRLAAADVLVPGQRLGFVHPILRDVVRADLPAAQRALAHTRAARILADGGAAAELVASHLMEGLPRGDPGAVATLVTAARAAVERGAPEAAAGLLARAQAEPPSMELRADVAMQLGMSLAALGRRDALLHLEEAVEWAIGPGQRALAAMALARGLFMFLETGRALALLDELAGGPTPADPDLLLRLEAELAGAARLHPEVRSETLQRLDRLAVHAQPARPATVALLANLALSAVERNEGADAVGALARQALAGGWLLGEANNLLAYAVNALTWVDLIDEAVAALTEVLDRGRRSLTLITMAYTARSRALLRGGSIREAEADARIAHAIAYEQGWDNILPFTASHLADALLLTGAVAEAAEVLRHASHQTAQVVPDYLDSLGRTCLAAGRPEEAMEHFLACGRQLAARGGVDAPAIISWRSHAALAAIAVGDGQRAGELARREHDLALASGIAGSIGTARMALGLASVPGGGMAWLEKAVDALSESPRRVARAQALFELGAATRRSGQLRGARPLLSQALDLARHLGATALAGQARVELLAAGALPRRDALTGVDALTASEARVAGLAVDGLTNRQIAQRLYVTMRTVSTHLTHVYQKLGIPGREELGAAMGRR